MSPNHHKTGNPRRHRASATLLTACTAVCAATVAAGTTIVGAGTANAEPTRPCSRLTAVLVPGTTETSPTADPKQPVGMLKPIGDGLTSRYGSDITVEYLPYPASPAPYQQSQSAGVQALSQLLSGLCPTTRIAMVGYSQGADVLGDEATAIGEGHGPVPASRIAAVGMVSDPRRDPATTQLGNNSPGEGIAGARPGNFGALSNRVRTECATGDMYCSTSPQSSPALSALGHAFTGHGTADIASIGESAGLSPAAVTQQVILVLSHLAQFTANIPAIISDISGLPPRLAAGDIPGAHQLAGDLNNNFQPIVQMASNANLHMVSQALQLAAPMDPSGWTGIASQVTEILARVDIPRIAQNIGAAQEIAWNAVDHLNHGDPLGAAAQLTAAIPVAADLATTAAAAFTGDNATHLTDLAANLTTADPQTTQALGNLAAQGQQAANFFTSGVHQNGYTTDLHHMLDWITQQIDSTPAR